MGREGLNKAARRATRESAVRVRLTKTGGGGGGGGRKFQGGRAGGGRHRQDRTSLCKKKDAAGAAGCGCGCGCKPSGRPPSWIPGGRARTHGPRHAPMWGRTPRAPPQTRPHHRQIQMLLMMILLPSNFYISTNLSIS